MKAVEGGGHVIFFYSLCGVGVIALGLAIGDLFGRRSRRPGISGKCIDSLRATTMDAPFFGGEYLPRPDDRPPH